MIDFRKAQPEDIPALIELRLQMLNEEGQKPVNIQAELMEFYLRRMRDKTLIQYIAIEEDKPLGTAAAAMYDLPPTFNHRTGVTGYITNVYTIPAARDRQIGSRLLELVIKECKSRGLTALWTVQNPRIGHLFDTFGFENTSYSMALNLKAWKAPQFPPVIHQEDLDESIEN